MSEWMCWHESDWKDDPSGNGKEPTEPGDRCLPDDLDFCTLLSGSSESSFVFSPPDYDHVIRSVGGSSTTSSVQVEKPHVVFTLSVDAKGKDCEVDESINVNVTIDLKQETTSTTHAEVLSHSVPADRLVWSPTLRPLDRLLATNIEMARLQQQLEVVEENGENEERVKRPRNAFMFFCSNQRPELQKLYPGLNNRTISQMLGAMWRSLSNEEKLPFQGEAAKEREDHKKQHPDWKYSIDKAKGVKRKIKAVKKLQRTFEREIKGKCTKKETLHDHTVTALDELWSPIEWTGGGNTQCLEISNIHTSEPAACWVTPSDREQELCGLTVSTALDLLDCHTDVDPDSVNDSVLDGQCDGRMIDEISNGSDATESGRIESDCARTRHHDVWLHRSTHHGQMYGRVWPDVDAAGTVVVVFLCVCTDAEEKQEEICKSVFVRL
ncbi:uncharacterized protein LOC134191695 isoform X2 [Corticium candelabrum]|uniref:uncharacterized protein LOC134191695 isoform X2 n=1 Tax=Corticium candelabrum TaxID=121492 RepID=UPI002E25B3FF|nr:uncharacterized protein LOC134191695 isoform X2 [Corticium candelabrum]